jgi:hypothetical protein
VIRVKQVTVGRHNRLLRDMLRNVGAIGTFRRIDRARCSALAWGDTVGGCGAPVGNTMRWARFTTIG